jgi:dishevelled associated activator of morphogenesis
MRMGLRDTTVLLGAMASDTRDPTDKFSSVLSEWMTGAQKKFDQLDQAFKDAENAYIETCKMFAEDPKSSPPGEFFGKIHQFMAAFVQAKTDNEVALQKQLEAEKKEREKQVCNGKTPSSS